MDNDKPLESPCLAPEGWNIHQRINWVRAQIGYVQKTKTVAGHGYKAVTHDEVTATLRKHMIKAGITTMQSLVSSSFSDTGQITKNGIPIHLYTGLYTITLANVCSPEDRVVTQVESQAMDTGDKASGKAMSYAKKYVYLKCFDIETGEDEESRIEAKYEREQISPDPVDMELVKDSAKLAMQIVDNDDEDYSKGEATSILSELSNDERIALQTIMKASKPAGTGKTYFSCFRDHLKLEREAAE